MLEIFIGIYSKVGHLDIRGWDSGPLSSKKKKEYIGWT
jgi:hypothetical protein